MLGIIIVVALVNYWLLIPTFFVGITFYLLRIVYLSTSRSVKRLEGLSKYPYTCISFIIQNKQIKCDMIAD
jgi:ATP-binding cassette subfamily C (CFTR/MRP) protein 4